MIRWSTNGRAASCNSTPQSPAAPEAITASAARVESGRVWPPSMTPVTFRYPPSASSASTFPV